MEDKGCTPELLRKLYIEENKTKKELYSLFNVTHGVLSRWMKESNIPERGMGNQKYTANYHIFDNIDTQEKAYWLGFLWSDGYVNDRRKTGRGEISIKLQLAKNDRTQLEKFKVFLESNNPIHEYKDKGFGGEYVSCRLMFSNMHMGKMLIEKYGLVPNRTDITKLQENISQELMRHFIRGVFDAEGSTAVYYHKEKHLKATSAFTSLKPLLEWIQDFLLENNITQSKTQLSKRYKDRNASDATFSISGTRQVLKFLEWLYQDSAIHIERKYDKYLELKQKLGE